LQRESARIFVAFQESLRRVLNPNRQDGYRAIAVDVSDGFLWISIGPHDQYERLLRE
jgi:hypothetical protein